MVSILVVIAPSDAYALDGEPAIGIKKIERHPRYEYKDGAYFDIAVVTLEEDITFSHKVIFFSFLNLIFIIIITLIYFHSHRCIPFAYPQGQT